MCRPIYVKDLKDQTGMQYPRPILHCARCGCEVSANAADYWNERAMFQFQCCGKPMSLVIKETIFKEVEP